MFDLTFIPLLIESTKYELCGLANNVMKKPKANCYGLEPNEKID